MSKDKPDTDYERAMQAVDRIIAGIDEEIDRLTTKKDYMIRQRAVITQTKENK